MREYYKNEWGELWHGDCLEVMDFLEIVGPVADMVLCDPPYGTTACAWDSVIPFEKMWGRLLSIVKPGRATVMTAAQPFTSFLVASRPDRFKYALVWKKSKICHFAQAPYRFLTEHEDVLVFSDGGVSKNAGLRMVYNPQGTTPCHKVCKGKGFSEHRPVQTKQDDYVQTVTGYPKSILVFASDPAKDHPTQKPVALFAYLIQTYTNPGETVLDFCAGSGTTAVAAEMTGRRWVCIEKEEKYCELIAKRLSARRN